MNDKLNSTFFALTTRRPVAITMIVLAVTVFGLISYNLLSLNLMPDISYPSITVRTEYEGAAPEEVETIVTRPLEQELGVVAKLQNISSISKAGQSDVILEFAWNTNINEAISDVREKIDQVFLPPEVDRPIILRYDPTLDPIMRVGVYGDKSLFFLRRISEEEIKRALDQIPGVAAIKVKGGLEEEIRVEINEKKLALTQINISQVKDRLMQENINLAGGSLKEGQTEYLVRTLNEFKNIEEMQNLVVGYLDRAPVYLKDIAHVYKTSKEREIVTKINNKESVEIEIYKSAEANIVEVAKSIRLRFFGPAEKPAELKSLNDAGKEKSKENAEKKKDNNGKDVPVGLAGSAPDGVKFSILSDQSVFIKNSIDEVKSAAMSGGLLAILILLIFLRNFKSTLIVALSIPISVLATFAPMNLMHVTLNIMSLGGLALGIGMLVDNSIVVLESIFRCREEGDGLVEATIRGTHEVGGAVTASTLTTVAVFFPIIFVKGVAGQIFGDMALTIVFSLLASLGVALVFIPMLVSRTSSLNVESEAAEGGKSLFNFEFIKRMKANIFRIRDDFQVSLLKGIALVIPRAFFAILFLFFDVMFFIISLIFKIIFIFIIWAIRLLKKLSEKFILPPLNVVLNLINNWIMSLSREIYPAFLTRIIEHPGRVTANVFIPLIALGLFAFMKMGSTLIPEVHQGEFFIELTMAVGTPVEETAAKLAPLEEFLQNNPLVANVATVAGTDKSASSTADEGENTAKVTVRLKPTDNNELAEEKVISKVRDFVDDIPGIQYKISRPVLFSFKSPVELQLQAYNLKDLKESSIRVRDELKKIKDIRDVKSSMQAGNPEIQIKFNRAKIAAYGLNIFDVASVVRNKVRGDVATEFKDKDRKIDIRVKVTDVDKASVAALKRLRVNARGDVAITLQAVADIILDEGPSQIRRESQQRTSLVTANLSPGVSLSQATGSITKALQGIKFPPEMEWKIAGQNKEMETSMNSLYLALALAIFLVYIVMASQFESFVHPFVIIFSIPLALFGVAIILYLLSIPLSVVVFLGMIMLTGIVVNNAIVLVDYINQLRERGLDRKSAVIQAGQARLRPILMTTLTTVLGLLPMAIGMGDGSEIRAPMAITVVAGLSISTLLTLVVIPTVYLLFDRKENHVANKA